MNEVNTLWEIYRPVRVKGKSFLTVCVQLHAHDTMSWLRQNTQHTYTLVYYCRWNHNKLSTSQFPTLCADPFKAK